MIEHQDGHADRPADDDVNQIHQQDGDRSLHENGFDEEIRVAGLESLITQVWELLRHRNGDAGKDAALQYLDGVILQCPKRPDEQQGRHHDRRQGDDGDGLESERERVDEFLNGERNDQREEPDGDRVGEDEAEDAPFQTE